MLSPKQTAEKFVDIGESKASLPALKMLILGVLAGAFIALAGLGSAIASVSVTAPSVAKLTSALIFPAGLAMVVVAGSELFTGNNLMVISVLQKRISLLACLKNWLFVYLGNLVGAMVVVLLAFGGGVFGLFDKSLAASAVSTAAAKTSMTFGAAFLKGILCNFLVCIAVWMATTAENSAGKIASLFLPIMLFVLCGFEHSVANMYYLPAGLICAAKYSINGGTLTVAGAIFKNLIPVTLGNIVGGAGLVALPYWFVHLRSEKAKG